MKPIILAVLATLAAACADDRRTVEVRMVSDEAGNRFLPERVEVRRGDVLRFTLASGIHGVRFSSVEGDALPEPTHLLNRSGEAVEIPVDLAPGTYAIVCDPHVELGMVGTVVVR
jgi:plastocyanin